MDRWRQGLRQGPYSTTSIASKRPKTAAFVLVAVPHKNGAHILRSKWNWMVRLSDGIG